MEVKDRKDVVLEMIQHQDYKPMKIKEIAMVLDVPNEDRAELEDIMDKLCKTGKVIKTKKGKFVLPKSLMMITGKFVANQKGFGFVEIEGEEEDVFIPSKYVNGAFHGDQVAIRLIKVAEGGRRKEGEVVEILGRGKSEIIGTYQKSRNFGFVIADNKKIAKDIFISREHSMNAVNGDKVVVKITFWGDEDKKPEGDIVEIIGNITDPETDILAIVRDLEIPSVFPEEVLLQVDGVSNEVSEDEINNRVDYRNVQTVTIDGEDAKDLDDAITIEKKEDRYVLGVHIADVTHYVKEKSPLDKEAIHRGTSVYLVDRVIPMLPRKLSNGICSLNQGEDRLALSCIMEIDFKGSVLGHKIAETIINVDRRMTYTNVKKVLEDEDAEVMAEYVDFVPMFKTMEDLAMLLRAKRKERGSIDFDFPEAKIIMDETGKPIDIKAYDRNVATKIIEEFMLLANETIAENFFWQQMPFVYRTHDEPDATKISNLSAFIYNFGYHIKGKGEVHPKELQKLLIDIEGSKEETIISRLTLRSMKKAQYTITNDGHYGLATKYYCHFTSPIRRYPDLQIHRIIKDSINGKMTEKRIAHYDSILEKIAKQSSETERRAEEAERETEKLKKVEYMQDKIGQIFVGVISSVTSFGLFVELENTVEGLVHVTTLTDDYYIFDKDHHCYLGEHLGKIYRIGDLVKIEVVNADKAQRIIDFEMVELLSDPIVEE
ncbi:MAG: ribonuclease R [Vallitaleaceae bacterium]|nr:ribonuclease R [Vallitaleaceae bacterium]